jgi:hypothetical protein
MALPDHHPNMTAARVRRDSGERSARSSRLPRTAEDPSTVKAGRNRLIANNEVRAHSLHQAAGSRFGISAEELLIESADLYFGQSRSETEVLTGSEPDMERLRTSDVKSIWIGENRFVTITRAKPKDYLVARADSLIADLRGFDCSPPHVHHGTDPAHYLGSRTTKQRWIRGVVAVVGEDLRAPLFLGWVGPRVLVRTSKTRFVREQFSEI